MGGRYRTNAVAVAPRGTVAPAVTKAEPLKTSAGVESGDSGTTQASATNPSACQGRNHGVTSR